MDKVSFCSGDVVVNRFRLEHSSLGRATCPSCGSPECLYECDGSQGADFPELHQTESQVRSRIEYNARMEMLESLLVSLVKHGAVTQENPKIDAAVMDCIWESILALEEITKPKRKRSIDEYEPESNS